MPSQAVAQTNHYMEHMEIFISTHEIVIRVILFFCFFLIIAFWESLAPRRAWTISKLERWPSNVSIVILNSLIVRLLFPAAAVGAALFAELHGWGLFNYFKAPYWMVLICSLTVLDLSIYMQHILLHAVPLLWRIHRMHHTDLDLDVSTGIRFHPIEI